MESPLEQNERHIAVLKDVLKTLDLPVRLGVRITPACYSFVLVSSKSRIDRPKKFDTSRIIKAGQIKTSIWNDIDTESPLTTLASMAKLVSPIPCGTLPSSWSRSIDPPNGLCPIGCCRSHRR